MSENRRFPRIESSHRNISPVMVNGEKVFSGNVVNVSRQGISFSSLRPLSPNTTASLSVTKPGLSHPIISSIKIIWSHKGKVLHTYGAKFESIKNEDKAYLLDSFYEYWKSSVEKQYGSRQERGWIQESS